MRQRYRNVVVLALMLAAAGCSGKDKTGAADTAEAGTDDWVDEDSFDAWGEWDSSAIDAAPEIHKIPDVDSADLTDQSLFDEISDELPGDVGPELLADLVEIEETVDVEVYVALCDPDLPCDDADPCTFDDFCTEAGCLGIPLDCSDDEKCTFDACADGECVNDLKPGWCRIAGACYQEGTPNPNNPCLECITAHKVFTWSADDTNFCDDGDFCTVPDVCQDGSCVGIPADCDDGNPCTEDLCLWGQCAYVPLNDIACEDGDLCTLDDICFAAECTAGETLRECDDFNQCTDDTCDPATGCTYTAVEMPCEDGDLCTVGDLCQAGQCVPGEPAECEDDNVCTSDSCSPGVGCKFINNSYPCDDADPCTLGDQCLGGVCKKGPGKEECDDANSCTAQWCAPGLGCQYTPLDNKPCNDEDGCTFGDHCLAGECVFEWQIECEDNNFCTDDDCNPEFGCSYVFNSVECDDGNACTVGDQCVQGSCTPGVLPLNCFEESFCADGHCDPQAGCVMEPLDGKACDDGDVCTVDDYCLGGECHAGNADVVDCTDGNVCTFDWCDAKLGCLHENIESPCDDMDLCTENDHCVDGQCFGATVNCDDGNQCTIESCDKDQGCQYEVVVSAFCQPQIVIEYPPRAAELIAPPVVVEVVGYVVHNAAPVAWVNINGNQVAVQADDTFTYQMAAVQGLNIIEAEIFDLFDGHDKIVQTYLMSTGYTPMNATNPAVSMVPDGVMIFLGQNVWDDNVSDPNDFATFFTYFFNTIDIGGMVPNPLFENGSYKVSASSMSYGPFSLDITCINGGIHMKATLPDLHIGLKAKSKKWYLPGASGDVDADKLVINMDVMLSVDGAGNVHADLQNVNADVQGLDVSLDGVLGFLLNWLVDFFEGMFASTLETEVENALTDTLPPTLEGALEDLAFDTEFEIPPLFGDADPVMLSMKSGVSSLDFSPIGGVIGLKAAVVTPKGVDLPSKGTIQRGGCLGAQAPFSFWMLDEIEMGIADDFLNQIPYAMWWAGLLTIPLDPEAMGGGSFEDYGIEDLNLVATGLLPPVITDCNSQMMEMQMGDLQIQAEMVMWGMPVQVTMYATFTASILIKVASVDGQTVLDMGVTEIKQVKLEVATVSENLVGSEDTLRMLIKQQVLPVFLEQITGDSLASFPLPEMDMTGMIPGMPGEAKLTMTPMSSYREKAYTVITGSVHE